MIQALNAEINKLEARLRQRVRLVRNSRCLSRSRASVRCSPPSSCWRPCDPSALPRSAPPPTRAAWTASTSNGKKKGEGNVRNGNQHLAWAFIEAANFARRYCPEAKRSP